MARLTARQQQSYINTYNKAKCKTVCNFYRMPSDRKKYAEMAIFNEMKEYNRCIRDDNTDFTAYGYKVLGGNCNYFTAGYMLNVTNPDGYARHYLIVHTHANRYVIEINRA